MLDIGGWEFLVVAFVLLMVGAKSYQNFARFARAMRQVRSMASEFTAAWRLASDNELGDLKST